MIAEAVALNGALTQIVKFTAGRERPFVHALPADQKPLTGHPADNNVSFYSSHTSFAFSLAVSTATVASMRRYRWAPVLWGVGLVSAAAVGYLRIAADQHYFTDVGRGRRRVGHRIRRPLRPSSRRGRRWPSVRSRAAVPC